jgi:hypothetical protein
VSNQGRFGMPANRTPGGAPPLKWHRRKRYLIPLGLTASFAALLVGVAIGATGQPATTVTTARQATAAEPTVTVTATATATVEATRKAQPQPTVTRTVIQYRNEPADSDGATVMARFTGTGTQDTAMFTVPGDWHLSWSYWGCPGASAGFQISEYNPGGSLDYNGVTVSELGSGRGPVATYAYGDGGTHYFSVSTEGCSWSLAVMTG